MKTNARPKRKARAHAPTVAFEVFHNGARVARAGMPGFGVVSIALHWVRRDFSRFPPGSRGTGEELGFHVGALDSNDQAWSRHVRWATPALQVGDQVEIRLSDSQQLDRPTSETRYRNRKRPEPPPAGDPSRGEVRDVVVWRAPRGVYIKAMNQSNGGPVALSPREAAKLATLVDQMARQPRRRQRSSRT